jgi:acyl-CoA hydrolase
MSEEKYADESVVTAAQLMTPDMANLVGNIHGGHVMRLADNLALVCSSRYAGTGTTTAAVDRIDFYEPVHSGDLLLMTARIAYVHHTSVEVDVEISAEDIVTGQTRPTNTCHFTFVALKDGKAAPVPTLVCRTREDKERYLRARTRRDVGPRYREERQGLTGQFDDLDEAALDALINDGDAAPASKHDPWHRSLASARD